MCLLASRAPEGTFCLQGKERAEVGLFILSILNENYLIFTLLRPEWRAVAWSRHPSPGLWSLGRCAWPGEWCRGPAAGWQSSGWWRWGSFPEHNILTVLCTLQYCTVLHCTVLYWEQVCGWSFPEQYPIQVRTSARVTHAVLTTSFWEEDTGTSTDYSSEHIIIWPIHLPILPLVPYPLSLRLCPENLQKESKMIQGSEIRQSLYTEIWMQQKRTGRRAALFGNIVRGEK